MTRLNPCHNRQAFADTLRVQDGWLKTQHSRVPRMVDIPFRNSRECVYSTDPLIGAKDRGCDGCRWKQEARA